MALFCSTRIGQSIEGKVPSHIDDQYKIYGCIREKYNNRKTFEGKKCFNFRIIPKFRDSILLKAFTWYLNDKFSSIIIPRYLTELYRLTILFGEAISVIQE